MSGPWRDLCDLRSFAVPAHARPLQERSPPGTVPNGFQEFGVTFLDDIACFLSSNQMHSQECRIAIGIRATRYCSTDVPSGCQVGTPDVGQKANSVAGVVDTHFI